MFRPLLSVCLFSALLFQACAYNELSPAGSQVVATTSRPSPQCKSLGTLTGKGGGGGGGLVSNEDLVKYALNDLRNQAAAMGATHVQTLAPNFGSTGDSNTTTSATIVGEALVCDDTQIAAAPSSSGAEAGCQNDAQCKGDRICVEHVCTEPVARESAPAAPPATVEAPTEQPATVEAPAASPAPASEAAPVAAPSAS
jgi:hypothetical protein